MNYWILWKYLSPNNAEGKGKNEGIKHGRNWLEDSDVLDEGAIPRISENKCRDENIENEEENFGDHVRLGLRLGDTFDDLHFTN